MAFSDTNLLEGLRELENQVLCRQGGATVFFCSVWLEQSNYCLKVFCVAWLSLSWSFGLKEQAFVGDSCLCLWCFWVIDFFISTVQMWVIRGKMKTQRIHYHVVYLVLRSLAGLCIFSFTFWGLLRFILYVTQEFLVVLGRRNREKYVYSIFLEAEFLSFNFFLKVTCMYPFDYASRRSVMVHNKLLLVVVSEEGG